MFFFPPFLCYSLPLRWMLFIYSSVEMQYIIGLNLRFQLRLFQIFNITTLFCVVFSVCCNFFLTLLRKYRILKCNWLRLMLLFWQSLFFHDCKKISFSAQVKCRFYFVIVDKYLLYWNSFSISAFFNIVKLFKIIFRIVLRMLSCLMLVIRTKKLRKHKKKLALS